MTVPWVDDTSPATCSFCMCNDMYFEVYPVRHYRKNREQYSALTCYILHHGMPGWVVERQDYAELRVQVSTVCRLATRPCSVQSSCKPLWQNIIARCNMSYEGCDVILRCFPPCEGIPLQYDCFTNRKWKKTNRVQKLSSAPQGGVGGIRCTRYAIRIPGHPCWQGSSTEELPNHCIFGMFMNG